MQLTAYQVATQYLGLRELPGAMHNPLVLGMLRLDAPWVLDDETAWCSAFANFVCFQFPGLARSKSLGARTWLPLGKPVAVYEARRGFDVVVLKRGPEPQPGPEVLKAPGHVGFFDSYNPHTGTVRILGGNQADEVSIQIFPVERILGIRRLHEDV